jgi:hypothetical protein
VLAWWRGADPLSLTPQCGERVAAGVGGGDHNGR